MSIYDKVSIGIMDKKVINEEQFKKLVIKEAKRIFSEGEEKSDSSESKRRVTFKNVESLINEMEGMSTSISSLIEEGETNVEYNNSVENWVPNQDRDLDVIQHNKNKDFKHINESEKDKWKRMLGYEVPKDEER